MKFYPSGNNFTQALLVMLVTNIKLPSFLEGVPHNFYDQLKGVIQLKHFFAVCSNLPFARHWYFPKYCMLAKPSKNAPKSEPHQNSNGRKPKVSRRARKELGGRLAVELVNKYINSSSLPEIPLFSSEHTKFASSLYIIYEFYTLVKRRLHQQYKELWFEFSFLKYFIFLLLRNYGLHEYFFWDDIHSWQSSHIWGLSITTLEWDRIPLTDNSKNQDIFQSLKCL